MKNDIMVVQRMGFKIQGPDANELEDLFDTLTDELSDLEDTNDQFLDSTVSIDFDAMRVEIAVTAVGDSFEEAEATADSCVRAAIHATGGITRDWKTTQKEAELACA